ncbi:hypothetical protein [Paenibacillus sp. SN-8-1]|uniref:hypothetical protein n=1 Tax=Paenibacillus sp. SN-8-1 TaxID=3435409 RepID=UPI003D9A8570
MLSDLERKLLRILWNYSLKYRHMPEMSELQRLTGRQKGDILKGINTLEQTAYITWQNKPALQGIVILEGWERGQSHQPKMATNSQNTDYWTDY